MKSLEKLKNDFDRTVESFKVCADELTKVNAEIDEQLLIEVRKLISGEKFLLRMGESSTVALLGSDRVIIKLQHLNQYGAAVYFTPDKQNGIIIDSGTIFLKSYNDIGILKNLGLYVDTTEIEETINRLREYQQELSDLQEGPL